MRDDIIILAVDDDSMNLEMLEIMLEDLGCTILRAEHGQAALESLRTHPTVDVVLLDLEMPVMNGYETLTAIKSSTAWRDIPVIVVTAGGSEVTRTLALGANDFIPKPYNPEELRLRLMNHVRSKKLNDLARDMNEVLEVEVARKTAALQTALSRSKEAEYEISLRLGRAAEFRDQETGMHTRRISELSRLLGELAGLSPEECEELRFASPLHDVGKIGIPDLILLKPGKLEPEEFDVMKLHTTIGENILAGAEGYPVIEAGRIIACQHHEKWDGSGYPSRLRGAEIHLYARIVAIVDVFDALLSERPYKKAYTLEKTVAIMEEGSGTAFDPGLLALLLDNLDRFVAIRVELADHDTDESPLQALRMAI
jgi:putative two-component system response regulator